MPRDKVRPLDIHPAKPRRFSILTIDKIEKTQRQRLKRYLSEAREGLIADLGPQESDLSAGQRLLIDRILGKLRVLLCIEEQISDIGVFSPGGAFRSILERSYLAYANSIRLDLMALGLKAKQSKPFDLADFIDTKKEKADQEPEISNAEEISEEKKA